MLNYGTAAELLFPTRCAGCGRYAGRLICAECNAALPLIRGPACRRCGSPMPYDAGGCPECGGRIAHLDAATALSTYREPMRSLIHGLKYGNGWRLAGPLGAMTAARLAPMLLTSRPLVTFVPMHRRKRRARGYDHAGRLAEGIGRALGLETVPLLERIRPTRAQSELSHEGRRHNVRGAFRALGAGPRGAEVVLVDDILTTGYTLCECAAVLKACDAARVVACVLARDLLEGAPRVRRPEGEIPFVGDRARS